MSENETKKERLDRELVELLNELRVALPGVQVLFAFLLTIPFTDRFAELSDVQQDLYFAAFIATAVSSVLLMTPTAYHRLRWRQFDKEHMLKLSNVVAIVGLSFLATAIALVVYLVTDLVFFGAAAAIATAIVGGVLVLLWFVVPISRRIGQDG